eukprot:6535700-Pyramimonas_sp.AAC.1
MHTHRQTAKRDYPRTTIGFGLFLSWSRSVQSLQRASEDEALQEAPPLVQRTNIGFKTSTLRGGTSARCGILLAGLSPESSYCLRLIGAESASLIAPPCLNHLMPPPFPILASQQLNS